MYTRIISEMYTKYYDYFNNETSNEYDSQNQKDIYHCQGYKQAYLQQPGQVGHNPDPVIHSLKTQFSRIIQNLNQGKITRYNKS